MVDSDEEAQAVETDSPVWRIVEIVVGLVVAGIAIGTVGNYLEVVWSMFELFVHFRHVYLAGALACLPVAVWLRSKRLVGVLVATLVLNGAYVLPWYLDAPGGGECSEGETVRLALANLWTSNRDYGAIREWIERTDPDVLVLLEFAAHTEKGLEETLARFEHRIARRRRDNFGMAVFSDISWQEAKVVRPAGGPVPQLYVELEGEHGPVHLWAVHPLPPVKPDYMEQRDELLRRVGAFAASSAAPVVVAGDLNTTMWSGIYGQLDGAGLQNARVGRGILGTWPSSFPIRLPIDHVLSTDPVETCGMQVGGSIGSDHRPVMVELAISPWGDN